MAGISASAEPPRAPPPIPVRSHLRNGSAYQLKLRAIVSEASNTSSVPVFETPLVEEIGCGLSETHGRRISAVGEGKRMHNNVHHLSWNHWEGIDMQKEKGEPSEHSYDQSGQSECRMRFTGPEEGHDDRLEPLGPAQQSESSRHDYLSEHDGILIKKADAQQGSHDGTMTYSAHLDCADHHSPSSHLNSETMEPRAPGWLTRGFSSPSLQAADSRGTAHRDYSCSLPVRSVPLSLFPPTSPSTGRREYAPLGANFSRPLCPMSPLQNGRDVYGNYISSSAQDYSATQSLSNSPDIQKHVPVQSFGIPTSSSPVVRLRGGGWNDLKPLRKTTSAEKLQESNTAPLKTPVEHDELPRAVTAVNDSGRRALHSARSYFFDGRLGKDPRTPAHVPKKPFTIQNIRQDDHIGGQNIGQRLGTQESDSTGGSSERRARVDVILNNHFGPRPPLMVSKPLPSRPIAEDIMGSRETQEIAGTLRSPAPTPRDEKRWNKKGLSLPQSPLFRPTSHLETEPIEYEISDQSDDGSLRASSVMSANTVDDTLINLPGLKSSNAYRKVERDREICRIQEQRQLHEEADRRREDDLRHMEEAQTQELDHSTYLSNQTVTATMGERRLHRHELPQMATVDEHYRPSTARPALHFPPCNDVPINRHQDTRNWHHQNYTIGHPSTIPVPTAATPPLVSKRQNSLRNVLAKAGKFGRFLLAVSSDPDLKTYSQRHPPGEHVQKERRLSGMSADRSGWPTKDPPTTGFGITPAALNKEFSLDMDGPEASGSGFLRSRKPKKDISELEEMRSGGSVVMNFGSKKTHEVSGRTFEQDLPGSPFTVSTQPHNPGFPKNKVKATIDSSDNTQVTPLFGTPAAHLGLDGYETSTSPQPQSPGYLRRRRCAGIFTPPIPEISLNQPDNNEAVYTRRSDDKMQPDHPTAGYAYHMHQNYSYSAVRPNRMTEKWLDDITHQDPTNNTIVGIRGGDGSNDQICSTNSSPTLPKMSFNSTLDPSTAATASCAHASFDEATTSARPTLSTETPVVRSSFSSDSEGKTKRKLRLKRKREKRGKGNVWRDEDKAMAMAMAMHSC